MIDLTICTSLSTKIPHVNLPERLNLSHTKSGKSADTLLPRKFIYKAMKPEDFHGCPISQDSSNRFGKLLSNRRLGIAWSLLLLTTVANYAVFTGGTVIAEVTPYGVRVEVVSRPR